MGFLRLLTNERVMAEDVFTADRAWRLLERLRRHDRVIFSPAPADLESTWQMMIPSHKTGANLWTDTFLAGFGMNTGCKLVTLDCGFHKFKKLPVQILGEAGPSSERH